MRGRRTARPRKTIGYVRVSTQEQAQSGFSLSAQRGRLEAYAHATGREPIDEVLVDDGFSASTLERPAVADLLLRIDRREVSAVIVTKLDRLSRNLRDILDVLERCQRTDTALLSASESLDTSSAVGRMLIHILGSFAEFEHGRVAERTSDVLGHRRKSRKVYCARTPFGYRREGDDLIAVPAEQSALEEMRRMHSAGATLTAIATMLESRGIPPRGARWYPSSVRAVLQSKMSREVAA
jgi:site-specific DNA recombinase